MVRLLCVCAQLPLCDEVPEVSVEPTFYFLRQNLFATLGMIEITGHTELTGSYSWTAGAKFDTPVPEQTLLLDPAYGTNLPDFFDTTIPVMSPRLIDGLLTAGVDNIEAYPMILRRLDTEEEVREIAVPVALRQALLHGVGGNRTDASR